MRFAFGFIGVAALALATAASAQQLSPISFSPEFQSELESDIGVREGEILRRILSETVDRAIARRGIAASAPIRIEISIIDAQPNKPTLEQLSRQPGLDYSRSTSIGGAELRAALYGADGAALTEVEHRYYTYSLYDLFIEPTTWGDARRAFRQFAEKVADAYAAHARAG